MWHANLAEYISPWHVPNDNYDNEAGPGPYPENTQPQIQPYEFDGFGDESKFCVTLGRSWGQHKVGTSVALALVHLDSLLPSLPFNQLRTQKSTK